MLFEPAWYLLVESHRPMHTLTNKQNVDQHGTEFPQITLHIYPQLGSRRLQGCRDKDRVTIHNSRCTKCIYEYVDIRGSAILLPPPQSLRHTRSRKKVLAYNPIPLREIAACQNGRHRPPDASLSLSMTS